MDFSRGNVGLLRRADFLQIVVPGISDVLFGNERAGIVGGFVLCADNAAADGPCGPPGWKLLGEFGGDEIDEFAGVIGRMDVGGEVVDGVGVLAHAPPLLGDLAHGFGTGPMRATGDGLRLPFRLRLLKGLRIWLLRREKADGKKRSRETREFQLHGLGPPSRAEPGDATREL
ncbi:MAG: hypothetical protein WBA18_11225 [Terracidiphilus sp.]